jgi:phage terminase large subunit-like protein
MGLDLSKTRDMSALVLVFKDRDDEDTYHQFPFFWLPENAATKHKHLAPYQQWHADGHLLYCEGDTIDQRDIRQKIQERGVLFDVQGIAYDAMYAEELTKLLEEEDGIERVKFPQTITQFAGPTADYERLIIAGRLHHNGHPVLSWQAGHVAVKTDGNNNKRPVKPTSDDHRKIDGMVAGIMGLWLASIAEDTSSVYEERGLVVG